MSSVESFLSGLECVQDLIFSKESFSENFLCWCLTSKKLAFFYLLIYKLNDRVHQGSTEGRTDIWLPTNPSRFSADSIYCTCVIISRGLYIFYPIFHCGLYCRAVDNAERLIFQESFSYLIFISTPSKLHKK